MLKRYEMWAEGLRKIFSLTLLVFLLWGLGATISLPIYGVLSFILYVFDITSIKASDYTSNIMYLSCFIFSPYFLAEQWGNIAKLLELPKSAEEIKNERKKMENELKEFYAQHDKEEDRKFQEKLKMSKFDKIAICIYLLAAIYAFFIHGNL